MFWYESANRLQNGESPWGDYAYYYDGAGNRSYRILDTGSTTTEQFTYPSGSSRLDGVICDGSPVRSLNYDAAGNIAKDIYSSATTAYSYNHAGRLSNVTVDGVQKGAYLYNAFGQLVSGTVTNTIPSGTVHYLHDLNGNVIAETDGAGSTVREYIWLELRGASTAVQPTGAATPLAVVSDVDTANPQLWFAHSDHLDRPVMTSDGAGSVGLTGELPAVRRRSRDQRHGVQRQPLSRSVVSARKRSRLRLAPALRPDACAVYAARSAWTGRQAEPVCSCTECTLYL